MLEKLSHPNTLISFIVIAILLICSGFFSGSETALTAASRARLHAEEKSGKKRAVLVNRLISQRERLLGSILLGNNFVNILASALMTSLMLNIVGQSGIAVATLVTTFLILIFSEILPKTYAMAHPNRVALKVAWPIMFTVKLLAPVVAILQGVVNMNLRLFGVKGQSSPWTAVDEIRGAVDLHLREGGVAKRARDQIFGILEIGELTAEDVMVHRKNLTMIDADQPSEQIAQQVLESAHTRIPLYRSDPTNVIGVLHAKDMLRALAKAQASFSDLNIDEIMREAWFVPETTSLVNQLRLFQKKREHFALVVDEYGALMGVLTLEDILEEIVGDIQDEFDKELAGVHRHKDGTITVRGDVPVRDLNRAMDWDLPDDEAVTIAGLLIHESQTIPEPGQTFSYYGYRFEIIRREHNQIQSIKIRENKTQV